MGDNDENVAELLRKKGEAIRVTSTLSPEKEDQIKKDIHRRLYYGGSVGAAFFMISLPVLMICLQMMCTKDSCVLGVWPSSDWSLFEFVKVFAIYVFICFLVVIALSLPHGPVKLGEPMLNGDREKFRMRYRGVVVLGAPFSFFALFPFFLEGAKWEGFQYNEIYNSYEYYLLSAIIMSFVISYLLYKKSFTATKSSLNIHGTTGSAIYDFFMGREVNPRIWGTIHIKPMIIIMSLASQVAFLVGLVQYQLVHREGNFASPTLLLASFGLGIQAADIVVFEENYLTSMTMKHDGAGFLFVFSKLVLVPMWSTFHARYIVIYQYQITNEPVMIVLFGAIVMCSIWFRFATADKALFTRYKDHPEVGSYNYIVGSNGKRLLVDGWWSSSRHPTYLCSICLALFCCLVTGLSGILPYTYLIFQVIHVIYRIQRNEDLCRFEYGEAWDVYCQKVPYKLLKYIY